MGLDQRFFELVEFIERKPFPRLPVIADDRENVFAPGHEFQMPTGQKNLLPPVDCVAAIPTEGQATGASSDELVNPPLTGKRF
jgi:hypothetical protein